MYVCMSNKLLCNFIIVAFIFIIRTAQMLTEALYVPTVTLQAGHTGLLDLPSHPQQAQGTLLHSLTMFDVWVAHRLVDPASFSTPHTTLLHLSMSLTSIALLNSPIIQASSKCHENQWNPAVTTGWSMSISTFRTANKHCSGFVQLWESNQSI